MPFQTWHWRSLRHTRTSIRVGKTLPKQKLRLTYFLRLFDRAISYCETVQQFREEYSPYHLDWILVRSFSWDSVAIMLTSVMRNHALDYTERGQRARSRIHLLFQNRHTIDYLVGNGNLWIPLQRLWEELKDLEDSGLGSSIVQGQAMEINNEWPLDFDVSFPFLVNQMPSQ